MTRALWHRTLAEAAIVVAASSALGFVVNAARERGLPLAAAAPYTILVPCPEPGGEVVPLPPDDPALRSARSFVIDAREGRAYWRTHFPGATNVPYDWLDPLSESDLRSLTRGIAASRATRVIVYGDGGHPDSGEFLGREISGRGIRNVAFVRGGAPALLGGSAR
jgi:hypothetical protein